MKTRKVPSPTRVARIDGIRDLALAARVVVIGGSDIGLEMAEVFRTPRPGNHLPRVSPHPARGGAGRLPDRRPRRG